MAAKYGTLRGHSSGSLLMSADEDDGVHAEFVPGSIKKIGLTNFMTHQRAVMYPSARVNFLLGANGSGKSSIVCALCLGLGGDVSDMERGKAIAAFVQTGKETASIQITLAGRPEDKGDIEIERIISVKPGGNKWKVNNCEVLSGDIKNLVEKFHIAMDNPCMFLPQEKVGKFSYLAPKELLRETIKSVGRDLDRQFTQLLDSQAAQASGTQALQKTRDNFAALGRQLKVMEHEKEQFEHFQELQEKAKLLELRLPVAELKRANEKVAEVEKSAESLAAELKELEQAEAQPKAEKQKAEADAVELKTTKDRSAAAKIKSHGALSGVHKRMAALKEKIGDARAELDSLRKGAEQRQKKIEELKAKIAALDAQLAAVGDTKAVDARYKELDEKRVTLQTEASALQRQFDDVDITDLVRKKVKLEKDLAEARNVGMAKRKALQKNFGPAQAAAAALEFIDENRSMFTGEVYGPVGMEIELKELDRTVACQVESAIPVWLKFAFVVTNSRDKDILAKRRFRVNGREVGITVVEVNSVRHYRRAVADETLRDVEHKVGGGCKCAWGDHLVVGPDHVLEALRREAFFHNSLFLTGGDFAERYVRSSISLPTEVSINCQTASFRTLASSVGGASSTNRMPVRDFCDFLHEKHLVVDTTGIEAELAEVDAGLGKLEARRGALQQQSQDCKRKLAALRDEMVRLREQKSKSLSLQGQRTSQVEKLMQYENAVADTERTDKQIKDLITAVRGHQLSLLRIISDELPKAISDVAKAQKAEISAVCAVAAAEAVVRLKDDQLKQIKRQREAFRQRLVQVQSEQASAKQLVEELKDKVKRAVKALKPEQTAKFSSLPDDYDTVRAELAATKQSIEYALVDEKSLQKYNALREEFSLVSAQLDKLELQHRELADDVDNQTTAWLNRMEAVVGGINEQFQKGLTKLNVRGLVKLDFDAERLSEAGIKIMVAFRDGETPQVLNKDVQSGGERALSTMMYLLALQAVTPLPFRIVDEINQGMDAHNERAVIEVLLKISEMGASASSSGEVAGRQLFMISPKLLPDLQHSRAIRSEIVFNGTELGGVEGTTVDLAKYFMTFETLPPAAPQSNSIRDMLKKATPAENGAQVSGTKRSAAFSATDVPLRKRNRVAADSDDDSSDFS